MILAIDAGNSRTKWGVFDAAGALLAQGARDNDDIDRLTEDWQGCADLRRAVLSCVAGDVLAARLQKICDRLALPMLRITSQAHACGVRNGYTDPRQLGSDRWAALVAAWRRVQGPCVVATAGTALTVDALGGKGEFLGGLVVPGYAMMRAALAAGTAGVVAADGTLRDFPASTADAVHSGALAALAGAVERTRRLLELREGTPPACLLGGGDAGRLATMLEFPLQMAPDLVLHGLFLLEQTQA